MTDSHGIGVDAVGETGLRLLQQIVAHDSGALSVEELDYRNTDLVAETINNCLRELVADGVVQRLVVDSENDIPDTYWAVTPSGIHFLKRQGFYDEVAVLSAADDALERTDRIREIEQYGGRPDPEWY